MNEISDNNYIDEQGDEIEVEATNVTLLRIWGSDWCDAAHFDDCYGPV